MPTGYTSKVLDGASFEEFALETATAFSYMARGLSESGKLKDGPLPDPEKAARNSYHGKKIAEAEKKLRSVLRMSFDQAARKAREEYEQEKKQLQEGLARISSDAFALDKMVKQVLAYKAPDTERHKAHKDYMLDQLKKTIEQDTDTSYYNDRLAGLKPLTGRQWKKKAIEDAKHDIEYHSKEAAEEAERLKNDVDFIAGLRNALKPAPKP
jgi:predicted ATP-binding protein involved in virulence